jgi:hypothetical protein
MDVDQDQINGLIAHPSESLNVEIKRWIDPNTPEGVAKIVKAAQAIRNRNGGFLVVGFDDKSLQPDTTHIPDTPRLSFGVDKIQAAISRYASEIFEVGISFGNRNGTDYPVIVIPEGVTAPVASKRDLKDAGGVYLLREGDVYFRTLDANGTPSTAKARPSDWRELVNICFENREADIGRFLRRHLSGPNIEGLAAALASVRTDVLAPRTLRDRAEALRFDGEKRFNEALTTRTLTDEEQRLLGAAAWQIALVVDPPNVNAAPTREFLGQFAGANPQYTGWPVWLDSRGFSEEASRPRIVDKAWQALIVSAKGWTSHLDFVRVTPKGEFYLWRALQDDLTPSRTKPGEVLDPILVILRVAEAIAVAISATIALGWQDSARLGFAFKWTKLKGRMLVSWANLLAPVLPGFFATDDDVETFVEVPAGTPASAIAPYVEEATRDLFLAFGGYTFPPDAIENWVKRLIERKLLGP